MGREQGVKRERGGGCKEEDGDEVGRGGRGYIDNFRGHVCVCEFVCSMCVFVCEYV